MEPPSLESLRKSLETPHIQSGAKTKAEHFLPWIEFSAKLAPKIRRILWHVLGNTDEALKDDLTSEVFTWVVETLKTEPTKFASMEHLEARTILKARSMAIDHIRREQKNPVIRTKPDVSVDKGSGTENEQAGFENTCPDPRPDPAEEASDQELSEILLNLLKKLKPNHREVLKMIILEGKTQQETADALGMPIGTVGVYQMRGIDDIKVEIGRHPHLLKDLHDKYVKLRLTCEIAIMALLLK